MKLLIATLCCGFAMGIPAIHAADHTTGKIYIPFAFTANHQQIPAGTYKVSLLTSNFMALTDLDTGKTEQVLLVRPDPYGKVSTHSALVFSVSGHRYWLKEAKFAGSSLRSQLAVQPKPEPGLAKQSSPATTEIAFNK